MRYCHIMDDFAEIGSEHEHQVDWLQGQIELMETWIDEMQAAPANQQGDIGKLQHHLNWLKENLAKAQG